MSTINDLVSGMRAQVAAHAEDRLWSASGDELVDALDGISALRAQLAELELRVLATTQVEDRAAAAGATSTSVWWAYRTRQTRPDGRRRSVLAGDLDAHETTRSAMARGEVAEDQARVIVSAVDALPDDLEPGLAERAEKELVHYAGEFDAIGLRRLGRTILEVVAPEIAEEHLRRQLEAEERAAAQDHRFTMTRDGHGRCYGRFTIPEAEGAMLERALLALSSPVHRRHEGLEPVAVSTPRGRGEAFAAYVSHYPEQELPASGGLAATVVVTMTMGDLLGDTETPAWLDTGEPITAATARRMACEAAVVPAVLGKDSEVLDLGRQARFHTKAQRLAIALRDQCCTAEGCDRPPGMCHVHHDDRWHLGGHTSVDRGRLLCARHHTLVHDRRYHVERSPDHPRRIRILRT
ncbi:HNH endonuclease [Marmoricola endophyticus]|uniref:HNH endonuclease n=1 Tax=Marmoricola endophyticus TaxID=2040280 RepID=A0A917BTY0_9ACTN|nr:HNH endonuclease signature motif containing protein [Marmoricola endophyticus]GGF56206.1 HNH endonuclease [Marmoricola endophyticus]